VFETFYDVKGKIYQERLLITRKWFI
jgi:hypothetical protein